MPEPVVIEIDGVVYPSIRATSKAFGVSMSTVSRYLNTGKLRKLSHVRGYVADNFYDIDPNHVTEMQAEIVFGMWRYRLTMRQVVKVGPGWQYWFDQAIMQIFNNLPGTDIAQIILTDMKGETLICEDENFEHEDWLKSMVISARLVNP